MENKQLKKKIWWDGDVLMYGDSPIDPDIIEQIVSTARQEERKEVVEIIETKLKNDPHNPVLIAGLEYVLTILSSLQNKE